MGLLEEGKNEVVENPMQEPIQDIDLSVTRKKRFRIDGDNSRILELNTSDMGIIKRLQDTYPKLDKLAAKVAAISKEGDGTDEESAKAVAKAISETDKEMRSLMDMLFNANVSEVCAPDGSMYDPFNGKYRFEHIIEKLSALYESNLAEEYKRVSTRLKLHTDKYTKKKKK